MKKILSKREKVILFTTICVIIFAIGFNFFIVPVLSKNDNLNKEINLVRAKLSKYLWLLGQKESLEKQYTNLSSISNIAALSPQQDTLVGILSELENMARVANIKIVDIRPQGVSKNLNLYKEILIDLKTEGTMEGYLKFIYNLETSLSLLKIKKFQLLAKPNSQTLEGNFSISQLATLE